MNTSGIYLKIKVTPKASKNELVGWEGDRLKIRLKAVPEKGEANDVLIAFLAEEFKWPKSKIFIVSGKTSRLKRLFFEGKAKLF